MPKIMTILYYTNSQNARLDCEILGIDKRQVKNLVRPGYLSKEDYSKSSGHWHREYNDQGEVTKTEPITTILKVNSDLLTEDKLELLHHVDDESYW